MRILAVNTLEHIHKGQFLRNFYIHTFQFLKYVENIMGFVKY